VITGLQNIDSDLAKPRRQLEEAHATRAARTRPRNGDAPRYQCSSCYRSPTDVESCPADFCSTKR
jgi:hypothetical protein